MNVGVGALCALGGLVALDSAAPIVPSEAGIIAASAQATSGSLGGVVLAAATGAFVGDVAMHAAGRRLGAGRLGRWMARRRFAPTASQFDRLGPAILVFGRFAPVGRTAVAVASGVAEVSWRRYLPACATGAVLWAVFVAALGRFGSALTDNALLQVAIGMLAAATIGVTVTALRRVYQRIRVDRFRLDPSRAPNLGDDRLDSPDEWHPIREIGRMARLQGQLRSSRVAASVASSVRLATPSLANTCDRCVFTVPRLMNSLAPISGLLSPSTTRPTTSSSVGVRLAQPADRRPR
jgi:membrane-associated protein